jgi:hypothetical protein
MAAYQQGKIEDARTRLAEAHRLIGSLAEDKNTDWLVMDRPLTRRRESPPR